MLSDIILRIARPEDLDAVDRLLARSYPALLKSDYKPSVMVTALPLIARAQPALLASGSYLLAERSGVVVGAGGWTLSAPGGRPGTRGTGHIRHVATDPDHVRQGIGRALVTQLLWTAKASGLAQMQCQSTLTAVPFYQSLGFVTQAEILVPLRPGIDFPAVLMLAQL